MLDGEKSFPKVDEGEYGCTTCSETGTLKEMEIPTGYHFIVPIEESMGAKERKQKLQRKSNMVKWAFTFYNANYGVFPEELYLG